jgi:hypothetical protein
MSKIINAIKQIQSATIGQERNMYADVLVLFTEMGHARKNIKIDTASGTASGIPDLYIQAQTGISHLGEWLVCEVKDEHDAFSTPAKRERIFSEKAKYISIDTSFFVMIDPTCMVIRPVVVRSQKTFDVSKDIEIRWQDAITNGADWFLQKTVSIHAENSGYSASLKAFREGDNEYIAFIDLNVNDPKAPAHTKKRYEYVRNDFYEAIRKSTQMLQDSCAIALEQLKPEIESFQQELQAFSDAYSGYDLSINPFSLKGKTINADTAKAHDEHVEKIKVMIGKNPSIGKLAVSWLPDFIKRVGKVEYNKKDLTYELFATETANMILARILLLRFFEDHGFFGDKRYICNGGVKAFQSMREYFDLSYTKLLKDVYEKAKSIYLNVFDEMELDWIFGSSNEQLSISIELSLMYLSRFNFQTVKGDLLTGIYDRFMSGSKRKRMGEYFTPPSIARYIIDRLNITAEHKVLDPSCGSGTFPIEVFEKVAGELIANGFGNYELAKKALSNIAGNDLNPFSAMLTQIQLLWHLLPLKDALKTNGFPQIRISEKHNSLLPHDVGDLSFDASYDLFSVINSDQYDFVIGNPPYVRPERSDQELTNAQAAYYNQDISVDKNLFTLFTYRALKSWCKPDGNGKLAFVIPLSICDNNTNQALRDLFMIGKRWRIIEIVDMESISNYVFDASVNPIIFVADTKIASSVDKVCIRIAGSECVDDLGRIDLNKSSETLFDYEQIWSHDGRILTKITAERLTIINKIKTHQTFSDIAYKFWQRKEGARIVEWQENQPVDLATGNWSTRKCISGGAAFRGLKPTIPNGFSVFKGENISACLIEGQAQEVNIDIQNIDDPSLWKYLNVMLDNAFAFLTISSGITSVAFNMKQRAFLNTASLFIPDRKYQKFPFDVLVLSNVYQFYYAIYLRMGVVEEFWSHLYPTNLEMLPWSENLLAYQTELDQLRQPFLDTCKAIYNRAETLNDKLNSLGAITFQHAVINHASTYGMPKVNWNCIEGNKTIMVNSLGMNVELRSNGEYQLFLSDDLYSWIEISDKSLAERLKAALTIHTNRELGRTDILQMPVPKDDDVLAEFKLFVQEYDNGNALGKLKTIINRIDEIVAKSFGIRCDEIAMIQEQMQLDAFLKNIKPSLPYTGKKKRGLLAGLGKSSRYA